MFAINIIKNSIKNSLNIESKIFTVVCYMWFFVLGLFFQKIILWYLIMN